MRGSAPPVNNNAARVAAADAGSSALQQRQLPLLQLPCPWPLHRPAAPAAITLVLLLLPLGRRWHT